MQLSSPGASCLTSALTLDHQHLLGWLWPVQTTSSQFLSSLVCMTNRNSMACHVTSSLDFDKGGCELWLWRIEFYKEHWLYFYVVLCSLILSKCKFTFYVRYSRLHIHSIFYPNLNPITQIQSGWIFTHQPLVPIFSKQIHTISQSLSISIQSSDLVLTGFYFIKT